MEDTGDSVAMYRGKLLHCITVIQRLRIQLENQS